MFGLLNCVFMMQSYLMRQTALIDNFIGRIEEINHPHRGWTLEVLNIVRRLVESRRRGDESLKFPGQSERVRLLTSSPTNEFTTADVYAFERELEQLHPDNRNIKAKIRQQLQELRDRNLLLHVDRNRWRLP